MLLDLVKKNRSYRRFHEEISISKDTLTQLVDLARLTPSGRNAQPLKYVISNETDKNQIIFKTLRWAAYLKDWGGPVKGERPSAYIIMLLDKEISSSVMCDHGIAAQTILLGAVEKGFGGCMIATIQKEELSQKLNIPDKYEILMVLALGKPLEVVQIEPLSPTGDIKYWRDDKGSHHVPKRLLKDIILDL
jgi:nitroreductase